MRPSRRHIPLLAIAAASLACVNATELSIPQSPPTSRSMLLITECNRVSLLRADTLPASAPVFGTPTCAEEPSYFVAFLPLALEDYGWEPGPLVTTACATGALGCCIERPLRSIEFDALYEGAGRSVQDERLSWPTELVQLAPQSRCHCGALEGFSQVELPGIDRSRIAKIDESRILLGALTETRGSAPRTNLHILSLSDLESPTLDLGPAELGQFSPRSFGITHDLRGRFVIGTSTNAALVGTVDGGFGWTARLPPDRNTRAAVPRPDPTGEVEIAAVSELYPTEFYTYRDGQWSTHGEARLITSTCRADGVGNGQRPAIIWLGPEELLVMPHSIDFVPPSMSTTDTHPHGLWHKRGDSLRWIPGPEPSDDCMSTLALVPGYGVVAGTQRGQLHILEDDHWRTPELFLRGPPPEYQGDVFALLGIEGGLLFGGRNGYLSYVQGDVYCGQLKPTVVHIQSIVAFGGGYLVATDGRGDLLGDSQLLRFELRP